MVSKLYTMGCTTAILVSNLYDCMLPLERHTLNAAFHSTIKELLSDNLWFYSLTEATCSIGKSSLQFTVVIYNRNSSLTSKADWLQDHRVWNARIANILYPICFNILGRKQVYQILYTLTIAIFVGYHIRHFNRITQHSQFICNVCSNRYCQLCCSNHSVNTDLFTDGHNTIFVEDVYLVEVINLCVIYLSVSH